MILILCLIVFTILGAQLASAESNFRYKYCENTKENYTTNSTYQANLDRVLSILPSSLGNGYGFYNFSYGQNSEKVYATGLCRGDIEPTVCRSCLNNSTHFLTKVCPNQKEAIGGFTDYCMLSYSNRLSFGQLETHPRFHSWNFTQDVSSDNAEQFSQNLTTLLNDLKSRAAAGGSLRKYATGNASALRFTLYAFVQCTPDLSQLDCENCLDETFGDIPAGYPRSVFLSGRVVTPKCNFRYEVYRFYGSSYNAIPTAPPSLPRSQPPVPLTKTTAREGKRNYTYSTGTVAVPISASVVLIIVVGVYSRVRKTNKSNDDVIIAMSSTEIYDNSRTSSCWNPFFKRHFMPRFIWRKISGRGRLSAEVAEAIRFAGSMPFDFYTLSIATDNFSEINRIAQSTFGTFYRGRLPNGQNIAVKSLKVKYSCHEDYFKNQVIFGAKLHHRNLVRLLGFCLEGDKRFCLHLVYEFLPISLQLMLDTLSSTKKLFMGPPMMKEEYLNWDKRYSIIRGVARVLLYLHADSGLKIFAHGDIKPSKILLDEDLNPKISCYGSKKPCGVDPYRRSDLDPDMANSSCDCCSDVFLFGQLLLRIVCGLGADVFYNAQQEGESKSFLTYARRNLKEGTAVNLTDPQMKVNGSESDIIRCIHIGLLCTQEVKSARPTMNTIVLMLNCSSMSLPELSSQERNFSE